jgi:transposase
MVTLSLKEERRLQLLNEIERRGMAGKQGAEILQISLRHFRRLLVAYRQEGSSTSFYASPKSLLISLSTKGETIVSFPPLKKGN